MKLFCKCKEVSVKCSGYEVTCQTCFKSWNILESKVRELENENEKLRKGLDYTSKELNEVLDQCYKDKNEEYYIVADKQYKLARSILKELGE